MRILAVGDIHGNFKPLMNYLKHHKVDMVILTGDITHFGPSELGEEILNEIGKFDIPVLAIPGNCDPMSIYSKIESSRAVNIHGRSVIIKDIGICGFGGSNPTPFDTPLEFEEVQIYHEAKKALKDVMNQEITLFITHAPPYGTETDQLPSGEHVGSISVRKIIEELQPSLNICGHIHEARGMDKIGKTKIINPGELSQGNACLIHIPDSDIEESQIKTEIIKFS